jgi:hypothetical protein
MRAMKTRLSRTRSEFEGDMTRTVLITGCELRMSMKRKLSEMGQDTRNGGPH